MLLAVRLVKFVNNDWTVIVVFFFFLIYLYGERDPKQGNKTPMLEIFDYNYVKLSNWILGSQLDYLPSIPLHVRWSKEVYTYFTLLS